MPSETLNAPKKPRLIKGRIFTGRCQPAFGQSVVENKKNEKYEIYWKCRDFRLQGFIRPAVIPTEVGI